MKTGNPIDLWHRIWAGGQANPPSNPDSKRQQTSEWCWSP